MISSVAASVEARRSRPVPASTRNGSPTRIVMRVPKLGQARVAAQEALRAGDAHGQDRHARPGGDQGRAGMRLTERAVGAARALGKDAHHAAATQDREGVVIGIHVAAAGPHQDRPEVAQQGPQRGHEELLLGQELDGPTEARLEPRADERRIDVAGVVATSSSGPERGSSRSPRRARGPRLPRPKRRATAASRMNQLVPVSARGGSRSAAGGSGQRHPTRASTARLGGAYGRHDGRTVCSNVAAVAADDDRPVGHAQRGHRAARCPGHRAARSSASSLASAGGLRGPRPRCAGAAAGALLDARRPGTA